MEDRQPVEVLENGAIRYAEYDSNGDFVQYRYLLNADGATTEGTPLNKANLLADATATKIDSLEGADLPTTPNDALYELAEAVLNNTNLMAQISENSYTGTGTYGVSNPNSIILSSDTDMLIFSPFWKSDISTFWNPFSKNASLAGIVLSSIPDDNTYHTVDSDFITSGHVKRNGQTIYWYSTSEISQNNLASTVYPYLEISF